MNCQFSLITLLACLFAFNCKGQVSEISSGKPMTKQELAKVYSFNTDSLLHHIKTLSLDDFEGRRTGTKGAKKAKNYIINQFKSLGVDPLFDTYEQDFSFKGREKTYEGTNVLGLVKGSANTEEYIIITAHYDHEGIKNGKIYNGADDDASGISALFAFADHFAKHPPKHNVLLIAFDGEELGLKGAYHFVESGILPEEKMKLNLNMDMISRSDEKKLFVVGTRYNEQFIPIIDDFKNKEAVNLTIGHDGTDDKDNWTYSSDHAAFHKAKIPFLYFGVPDHEDYHKPTDDFENIHPKFYKDTVQIIIDIFEKLDAMQL